MQIMVEMREAIAIEEDIVGIVLGVGMEGVMLEAGDVEMEGEVVIRDAKDI